MQHIHHCKYLFSIPLKRVNAGMKCHNDILESNLWRQEKESPSHRQTGHRYKH